MYFCHSNKKAKRFERKHNGAWLRLAAILCLSGFLANTQAMAAAIYKTVDADGNVIFTDQPLEDAQALNKEAEEIAKAMNAQANDEPPETKIVLNPSKPIEAMKILNGRGEALDEPPRRPAGVLVAPSPKNPPKSDYKVPTEPKKFLPVTVVEILTPIHNTTLNDPIGKIWVELQSYPTSLKNTGLTAQLWMDDRLMNSGQRPTLSIDPPTRGTHRLQVKLVDDDGRLYLESDVTELHVKYKVAEQ